MRELSSENPSTDQEAFGALKCGVLESHLVCETLLQASNVVVLVHSDCMSCAGANQTADVLLVWQSRDTHTRLSEILHVVVHPFVSTSQELECFKDAGGRNESIGRGDSRDDVLDNTHG